MSFKRILPEDFDKDSRPLVTQLAYVVNPMIDTLNTDLNNGLTFSDNISAQIKTLNVSVDAKGTPSPALSFKWDLSGRCIGLWCIYAANTTTSGVFPTGQPFLSFIENNGQVTVINIAGLQASQNYTLRVIALN